MRLQKQGLTIGLAFWPNGLIDDWTGYHPCNNATLLSFFGVRVQIPSPSRHLEPRPLALRLIACTPPTQVYMTSFVAKVDSMTAMHLLDDVRLGSPRTLPLNRSLSPFLPWLRLRLRHASLRAVLAQSIRSAARASVCGELPRAKLTPAPRPLPLPPRLSN